MTEVLTTTARELAKEASAGVGRIGKRRILATAVMAGALAGGTLFAVARPSAEEIEQAHWVQVVDYYGRQYQTMSSAGSTDRAHWQAVVDYYEQQWLARQR